MDQIINIATTLALEFVELLNEMSPYLLLGFLIAGILHVALPANFIQRFLGKKNFASVVNASLVGVPLLLCSCGVIPAGVSLHKDGASKGSAVSFLTSTPQTGVDSILVTYSIIGLPFALIRPIVALITGIFGGFLTDKLVKDETQEEQPKQAQEAQTEKRTLWQNLVEMFRYAFVELLSDISKWLLVGLVVATLISVFVPDSFFTRYLDNPFLSMASILLVSIPFYVCSTGSVPIAAVLLMKGISPGAAFVFLMAGPATNASTITVVGRSLGKKTLTIYLTVIATGAIIAGLIINHLLPPEWFAFSASGHPVHAHDLLPLWLTYGSSIFLAAFMVYAFIRPYLLQFLAKRNPQQEEDGATVLSVTGMTCSHCKAAVENGVRKIGGIETVQADLLTGQLNLVGDNIDIEQVKKTISELGYQVEG